MEIPELFTDPILKSILCVEMHTTGEPTRIIYKGFPELSGTLLEQRAQAKKEYDHIRTRLMLEPRGHFDMYGALLRPETELTKAGEAHIGVLFMTNDGFSTMCGHATIALGRFLIDTHELAIFPRRDELEYDSDTSTTLLNLHAPCGLVKVTVPTTKDGLKADLSRPVSFDSVPSFATGIDVDIPLPIQYRWPELGGRESVKADFSYGGTFYCMISAAELGFPQGLANIDLDATNKATKLLKAAINADPELRTLFHHTDHEDLGFLYSIITVDDSIGLPAADAKGAEGGLCYFADQQIDRSPTGGGVAARIALAQAKGSLPKGDKWTYHSLVSYAYGGKGSFTGSVVEELEEMRIRGQQRRAVRVRVEGFAYYTGFHSFVVEDLDPIGEQGFTFNRLGSRGREAT
jgi:trans-L-3-hydroxyproline dehydratase